MKTIRTVIVATLVLTLGCSADTELTAPARSTTGASSSVAAGAVVHLAFWYFPFGGDIQAGSRMIVTSYEVVQFPLEVGGITYTGLVQVVHPQDGGSPVFSVFTDTVLQPGTMLEATGMPSGGNLTFDATVVVHGASR